jgi:site-specific DNA recombinase
MMPERVAIYARVSSDQQAEMGTVDSQVEALKERLRDDGHDIESEYCFVDDGFSGSTLLRPALERLRDVADAGVIDRVYVHSPDRLARKYAYQVVLLDEFQRCGVQVTFLNHKRGETPEEELLLQVQGMVAEYERAKIVERSRRGKLHAARRGSVNVLGQAPYGYEYIPAALNDGAAQFRIVLDRAAVARKMFEWVGRDRVTMSEVCRRLHREGIRSPSGNTYWSVHTVRSILKNSTYVGRAIYGKTRACERKKPFRPRRNAPQQPRQLSSCESVPPEEWITIPVPAIVTDELFERVQEQLTENGRVARQRVKGATYLLQGLIRCGQCGYVYGGHRSKRKSKWYTYYRCNGDQRIGAKRTCNNKGIATGLIEDAVWKDVCEFLENPDRIKSEFERRLTTTRSDSRALEQNRLVLKRLERNVARLTDAYVSGLVEKSDFERRLKSLRERIDRAKTELSDAEQNESDAKHLELVIARLKEFTSRVRHGLDSADWKDRREIIREIVDRVELDHNDVRVVYRVDPRPFVEGPRGGGVLQHRLGREHGVN